jgi:hypothetical protein
MSHSVSICANTENLGKQFTGWPFRKVMSSDTIVILNNAEGDICAQEWSTASSVWRLLMSSFY